MFLCVFEVSCRLAEVQVCSLYVFLRVSGVSVCSLHVFLRVFRPPEAQLRPTDAQQRPEEAHSGPHSPSKAARVRDLYVFSRVFTCIFEVPLGAARAQFIRVFTCFFEAHVQFTWVFTVFWTRPRTAPDGSGRPRTSPDGPGHARTAPDMPGRPRRSPGGPWSPTEPFVKIYIIHEYPIGCGMHKYFVHTRVSYSL